MPRARPNEGGGTAYVPAPAPQVYVPVQSPPSEGPLAGWYRDPGGRHQYRFWNGSGWTRGVADGPYASQDFLPKSAPWPARQNTPR